MESVIGRPCEQYGPERARHIQELIADAAGVPVEEACDDCPIRALVEAKAQRERPSLLFVS